MMNYVVITKPLRKVLMLCCAVVIGAAGLIGPETAMAGTTGTGYRAGVASDKFADTYQFATTFTVPIKSRFRTDRVELAFGVFGSPSGNRPFVSFGPVWQLPIGHSPLFLELGVSPTLLAGSSLDGRDLGGVFHFTSSATFGANFGQRGSKRIALRIQHTSNGGLHRTNPGIDMIGISVAFDFAQP